VVRENSFGQLGKKGRQRLENIGAAARVLHYRAPFFGSELLWFLHDVGYCLIDFPDVMKERNTLNPVLHSFVEISGACKSQCILRNASNVRAGLRIVCINGIEERLETGGAESFESNALTTLIVVEHARRSSRNEREITKHASSLGKKRTGPAG